MLATITVEEAQLNLKDVIDQVAAGQAIITTRNQQPVARLVSELPKKKLRPAPGPVSYTHLDVYKRQEFDRYVLLPYCFLTDTKLRSWRCW